MFSRLRQLTYDRSYLPFDVQQESETRSICDNYAATTNAIKIFQYQVIGDDTDRAVICFAIICRTFSSVNVDCATPADDFAANVLVHALVS